MLISFIVNQILKITHVFATIKEIGLLQGKGGNHLEQFRIDTALCLKNFNRNIYKRVSEA